MWCFYFANAQHFSVFFFCQSASIEQFEPTALKDMQQFRGRLSVSPGKLKKRPHQILIGLKSMGLTPWTNQIQESGGSCLWVTEPTHTKALTLTNQLPDLNPHQPAASTETFEHYIYIDCVTDF